MAEKKNFEFLFHGLSNVFRNIWSGSIWPNWPCCILLDVYFFNFCVVELLTLVSKATFHKCVPFIKRLATASVWSKCLVRVWRKMKFTWKWSDGKSLFYCCYKLKEQCGGVKKKQKQNCRETILQNWHTNSTSRCCEICSLVVMNYIRKGNKGPSFRFETLFDTLALVLLWDNLKSCSLV